MLPSLTVVVVSRKDILVFDTSFVNFIDGWILLACSKNSSSSLSTDKHQYLFIRRPKSIKDTLVRAAVSRPSSTVCQCKPCGDKRCKCCLQLQHTQVFHSKTTGKEYKIFCNVNCKTPNVVYLLDCHVCGSQYVGESVQPFNKRMNGHRSDLTKKTLLPVSQHFVSPGHSLEDFGRSKIYIIDHNSSWKENQRQKKEIFWIRELQTLHPKGINKKA